MRWTGAGRRRGYGGRSILSPGARPPAGRAATSELSRRSPGAPGVGRIGAVRFHRPPPCRIAGTRMHGRPRRDGVPLSWSLDLRLSSARSPSGLGNVRMNTWLKWCSLLAAGGVAIVVGVVWVWCNWESWQGMDSQGAAVRNLALIASTAPARPWPRRGQGRFRVADPGGHPHQLPSAATFAPPRRRVRRGRPRARSPRFVTVLNGNQ